MEEGQERASGSSCGWVQDLHHAQVNALRWKVVADICHHRTPRGQSANCGSATCHRHGNQGTHDTPSKGQLEDEFKSSKDDDVIPQILERGNIVESEVCILPIQTLLSMNYSSMLTWALYTECRPWRRQEHFPGPYRCSLSSEKTGHADWKDRNETRTNKHETERDLVQMKCDTSSCG